MVLVQSAESEFDRQNELCRDLGAVSALVYQTTKRLSYYDLCLHPKLSIEAATERLRSQYEWNYHE